MGSGYKKNVFISQAEKAIDMMMAARKQKDVTFAGQILDECVKQVLDRAVPFDDNVAEMRALIANSFRRNPEDDLYVLRGMILERDVNRLM